MKKETTQNKQNNNTQTTRSAEGEAHDNWIAQQKAKVALLIDLACTAHEREQAERARKLGRWASAVDAFEGFVHATFDVAEEAVLDAPRQHAKVQRVRDAVIARLGGDNAPAAELADIVFTVGLLAQLVDDDFGGLGLAGLPDTLLATPSARGIGDALVHRFARGFCNALVRGFAQS